MSRYFASLVLFVFFVFVVVVAVKGVVVHGSRKHLREDAGQMGDHQRAIR
jgi:hypothetical protein